MDHSFTIYQHCTCTNMSTVTRIPSNCASSKKCVSNVRQPLRVRTHRWPGPCYAHLKLPCLAKRTSDVCRCHASHVDSPIVVQDLLNSLLTVLRPLLPSPLFNPIHRKQTGTGTHGSSTRHTKAPGRGPCTAAYSCSSCSPTRQ